VVSGPVASCKVAGTNAEGGREDGCHTPSWMTDPLTEKYKDVFQSACNAHNTCYVAPWDTILGPLAGQGFDKCNNSLWNDMNGICNNVGILALLECRLVASVWADAMNLNPGRSMFWNSFATDQQTFTRPYCLPSQSECAPERLWQRGAPPATTALRDPYT
jgi:hypothetical protein